MIESKPVQGASIRTWASLILIAALVAYQPAWKGTPLWDDAAHMTQPGLRSLTGLLHIWTEPGATLQYYPVAFSSFWVEDKLWGDSTLGYHLVNILLHVTGALLLFRILRRLEFSVPGLAAAIFALHPVQVESVAWIAELKNTLSGVCYLGAALAYLKFDQTRNKGWYAGALALFVIGLLTKTVIATLPAALLVVFWWQRGILSSKKDGAPLIPFFVVGIVAGLFTSWMERNNVGASGSNFNFSIIERCLIAGHAVWFYLAKLFWPADLIFSYPRWKISHAIWWQYLFPAALVLLLVGLWILRRWARGPLAVMLFFIGTLFPALGFLNVFPFKYSFVADHFQYLACIGPIVAASFGIHAVFCELRKRQWEIAFCATLLAVLWVLTWRQSHMYTDIETLWRTTIARNPQSWLAQGDLGALLFERGQVDQAIVRFRASLAIEPDDAEAVNNLGAALEKKGELNNAMDLFRRAFALRPQFAEAHWNLGNVLLEKGQIDDAILEYRKAESIRPDSGKLYVSLGGALLGKGQMDEAIDQFQKAVVIQPELVEAQNNLGNCLLRVGRIDEAIAHLEQALATDPGYAQAHYNLGNAFLQKHQVDEAIEQFQKLVAIQPDSAEARRSLGIALIQRGSVDEAIAQFQKALAIQPGFVEVQKDLAGLAWRLATSSDPSMRNGAKAVELAEQTDKLSSGNSPGMAAILAAACAEAGHFDQAVAAGQRALNLAASQNNAALASTIQTQLDFYKSGRPFRDALPRH
jgi:tetratricopeptide (TPR) repeat protein